MFVCEKAMDKIGACLHTYDFEVYWEEFNEVLLWKQRKHEKTNDIEKIWQMKLNKNQNTEIERHLSSKSFITNTSFVFILQGSVTDSLLTRSKRYIQNTPTFACSEI